MKNDELTKLIENSDGKDVASIVAEIQRMAGIDRQSEIDKSNAKINEMQVKFDADIKALNDKHATESLDLNNKLKGYEGYVNPNDHQKVVDELNIFKSKETKAQHKTFLKSQGLKDEYVDLIEPQLNWNDATFNAEKSTFEGESFIKSVNETKSKYGNLFETPKSPSPIKTNGYYGGKNLSDVNLTDL